MNTLGPPSVARFALHFAVKVRPKSNEIMRSHQGNLKFYFHGDSFLEWGEDRESGTAEHGMVFFSSAEDDAYETAIWLYEQLVKMDLADVRGNCMNDDTAHVPFAVTSAHIWSAVLNRTGRSSATEDWAEHDNIESRQSDDERLLHSVLDAIRGSDVDALEWAESALSARLDEMVRERRTES